MEFLYARLQRRGFLPRDCQRMVNQDRNVFAACMVATGDADAMVTGLTRSTQVCLDDIGHAIDPRPGGVAFGLTLLVGTRGRTMFIADTHDPFPALARNSSCDIAIGAARTARQHGPRAARRAALALDVRRPRMHAAASVMRDAVELLDKRKVDFEYDGEMSPDVALDPELRALYPFCRLTGPANVLVMPGLHSAHITSRLSAKLEGGTVIGPVLIGLERPVQILPMDASVSQVVDMACMAAAQAAAR